MTEMKKPKTNPDPVLIQRLALIDDAEFDQMLYRRLIERSGLVGETLTFLSAEDAIAYFERPDTEPVDAILLDINMPGMSGFDFLDYATGASGATFTHVVIVMLTTSLNPSDLDRAHSYDLVRDYIYKPLEEQHLHQIADLIETPPA